MQFHAIKIEMIQHTIIMDEYNLRLILHMKINAEESLLSQQKVNIKTIN